MAYNLIGRVHKGISYRSVFLNHIQGDADLQWTISTEVPGWVNNKFS